MVLYNVQNANGMLILDRNDCQNSNPVFYKDEKFVYTQYFK